MDAVLCAVLLLLVVASGHQCPLGFEPDCSGNEVRRCKCRNDFNFSKCDEEKQQLYLQIGYCMWSYNDTNMTVVIAECPYIHPSARNSSMLPYFPLPPNMTASEVNSYMCGEMNRTGRLCGRCENGTGPSLFSPDLKCVECLDSSYGWAVYLAAEFIPITVCVLLVILFRIRLCADYINALVFFCNITSAGLLYYRPGYVYLSFPSDFERKAASILLSVYDIINLKFFQNFFPPLCISEELTNLEVIALRYLVTLYPLFLVVVIYVLVCLYDRNFKPLVLVWRPFSAVFSCFRKQFNVKHSLIHAFASFFLLSFFSSSVTSVSLLAAVSIHNTNDEHEQVFYCDGSVQYDLTISTSILAITVFVIFIILPTVLLLAYPTRTFQKCLNCCGLRCLPLHIFMDAFQGCYKNGTDGTRDYRYFAGLYLLLRYLVSSSLLHYFFSYNQSHVLFAIVFSFSFALCRPYKNSCFNVVDCLFHAILALVMFLLFTFDFSSAERSFLLLCLCIPVFYLIILTGCFLFTKCKTAFSLCSE